MLEPHGADAIDKKVKVMATQRRGLQQKKFEYDHGIEHGFAEEEREKAIQKHAKRLMRDLRWDSTSAMRIARKQHGMSTMKPKDDAMNRLLVIKDSPTERAMHGTSWEQHGIRPADSNDRRRMIETAKLYADQQRQDRKDLSRRRRSRKPRTAVNMMEKHDIPTGDESDEETFPAKPEMAIFTLVDDDSDDELGAVDLHALQYMRKKSLERRLVHQAYEDSKAHKEEALRILRAPANTQSSIFDWTFD